MDEGSFLGSVGRRRRAMPADFSDSEPAESSEPAEDNADSGDTAAYVYFVKYDKLCCPLFVSILLVTNTCFVKL